MDGYMYNLDPYHQASAAPRYQPSYALERRSTYGLPSTDPYARYPIDPFSGYGAPAPYQSEPRYVFARRRPTPASPHNLGPKKKPFKQTQKVRFSEGKEKKDAERKSSQTSKRIDKPGKAVPLSHVASLAKETQELHNLFRSGVDTHTGRKPERKTGDANGAAQKRKADIQMQNLTPSKYFESGKEKKKNKKSAKDRKVIEIPLPTEEELKDLELQRGFCQSVSLFFGFPDVGESDGKGDESKEPEKDGDETEKDSIDTEKPPKPEEKKRTPEEEKEIEAKSFKFFSRMFTEHQELRNLYVEKCNSGSFECLVCRSADATKSKTFWNLVSLVIHTKMLKKMEGEHTGLGRAVSAVLGWDHANIPKVPWECRPVRKLINQGKEETKKEPVQVALADQVQTINEEEEENATESPSEDVKEE